MSEMVLSTLPSGIPTANSVVDWRTQCATVDESVQNRRAGGGGKRGRRINGRWTDEEAPDVLRRCVSVTVCCIARAHFVLYWQKESASCWRIIRHVGSRTFLVKLHLYAREDACAMSSVRAINPFPESASMAIVLSNKCSSRPHEHLRPASTRSLIPPAFITIFLFRRIFINFDDNGANN